MKQRGLIVAYQPDIDWHWFDVLNRTAGVAAELYTALTLPPEMLEKIRIEFYASNCAINPNLRPVHIKREEIAEHTERLLSLQDEITNSEPNTGIVRAYTDRIEELVTNNNILLAATSGHAERFTEQNILLYGQPDKEIFASSCAWLREELHRSLLNPNAKASAEAALAVLPDLEGDRLLILPPPDTFARVRKLHFAPGAYFEMLFDGTRTLPDVIDAETGDPIIKKILRHLESGYHLISSPNHLWGIRHQDKVVFRPDNYVLKREAFIGIIAHEIGSHLLERINGQHQALRLLAVGLDHSEHGSEGRAYLREQIVYKSPDAFTREISWLHIILQHAAISMAVGLTGELYDFAKLYKVIFPVYVWWQKSHSAATDSDATAIAHQYAWELLTRVLQGTDGTGDAYRREIVYLEGTIACWRAATLDPTIIFRGDVGKFDITNAKHLDLLRALDVLPAQIER